VDRLLPEKLEPERPGILNWLIAGVGDWLAAASSSRPRA
jgi:phage/plasmid-associated DNA primase